MEDYYAKGARPSTVIDSPKARQSDTVLASLQDRRSVEVEQVG